MKSITPGIVGSPKPKKPKRNTHANIDINITIFIPKRFRKNGIIRIHRASLTCEIEVRSVALLAAKELAMAASVEPLKLVMNGPAKPLVT
jgi:hypothetical protein